MSQRMRKFFIGMSILIAFIVFTSCLPNKHGEFSCVCAPLISKITSILPKKKSGASDNTPVRTTSTQTVQTITNLTDGEIAAIKDETSKVVKRAAAAMKSGDKNGFLNELDPALKAQLGNSLDLSSPKASSVATAMSNAKVIELRPGFVLYEMKVDSATVTFFLLREGEEWKIGGL